MRSSPFPGCEIHERIGEGGIADVFRATWRGRDVALKVLRDPDRAGLRKRFIREGRLLQRLSHPGLVRCLDVLGGDQPALVLDLLVGVSLDVRLQSGALEAEECVILASSVLRTLGYLHENGIVHRDMKAANVFLCSDRRVVVMDLGLAADASDPLTTTLGDVLGTHAYMAPEQIAGAETDHRVDLYSLGVTLYEAVCGERPYHASGLAAYLHAHRAANAIPIVERVPTVSVRLAALIDRLMARDPAARPSSAAVALALLTGSSGVRRQLEQPQVVGREGLRGALEAVLDVGGVLRVLGELGSGLGAAARLARSIAREEGVEHVAVRCRARAGPEETLAALVRELQVILGPVVPDLPGVCDAIRTLCLQDRAFLVVVEDLDVAPEGVAELFGAIVDRVPPRDGKLALVVTGRALPEVPAGRDYVLRPLTLDEVRVLVSGMLGTPTLPTGLDVALAHASGGLPALVVAVLREHVERGTVWPVGTGEGGRPRWAWEPSAPMVPGEDTARMFERWLRNLPEATRALVRTLAVAGGPVPMDLLLTAANADPSGVDLGPALRNGLCTVGLRDGEEWVSLRRAVLEPFLANSVTGEGARALHLALAEAVRHRPGREWEQRFLILHSALGARNPEETERLVELGDWLAAGSRPIEALEALDRASGLPTEDPAVVARLALARSDALRMMGRLPEARVALDAGRRLAAASSPELARRAVLALAELQLDLGSFPAPEVLAVVDEAADSARARLVRARLAVRGGDLDAAEALFGQTLDLAPPGPVDRVGIAARIGDAGVAVLRGELGRAVALYRGLAAELRSVDRPLAAVEALTRLAEVHRAQGRIAASLEALRTAQDLAGERTFPWALAALAVERAAVLLECGDTAGASELLMGHAACGEPYAPWNLRLAWLDALADLRAAEQDTPAALAVHLRAVEAAEAAGDLPAHTFHSGAVAILTADVGAVGQAADALTLLGIPRLQARLLALGGRTGRDPDVLLAAEDEARAAGDQMLLLGLLHDRGDVEARTEARVICRAALDGLFGPLRDRLRARPVMRWALGERTIPPR